MDETRLFYSHVFIEYIISIPVYIQDAMLITKVNDNQ